MSQKLFEKRHRLCSINEKSISDVTDYDVTGCALLTKIKYAMSLIEQ